jgi:hypothetical protein
MKAPLTCSFIFVAIYACAQSGAPGSVTVPITLDHNRALVEVALALPDGSKQRVRAWVDNGNPELTLSRHLATLLALAVTCGENDCTAPPPHELEIGGMSVPLSPADVAHIPLRPVSSAAVMAPGMNAEINIPSTILRNYDVLFDFPGRHLTIGNPGTVKFNGVKSKVMVNAANGLIEVPGQIENKKYNLALDLGSSISFLSPELFDKLAAAHPDWPQMTGAIGPANMWGLPDEPTNKLFLLDRLQYGPVYLTSIATVEFSKERFAFFEKRAGIATAGLLGQEALMNYRVGLDYAHSAAYFEIGRTFKFPDFDLVGLILRAEDDGRFTLLAVANYDDKASVADAQAGDQLVAVDGIPVPGSTLGQVLLMLGGEPGKERRLTLARNGKQFEVVAEVHHFLAETDAADKGAARQKRK